MVMVYEILEMKNKNIDLKIHESAKEINFHSIYILLL